MEGDVTNLGSSARHSSQGISLGTLLRDTGKLDQADIDKILDFQRMHQLKFGEAACRLGLISKADLRDALMCQALGGLAQPPDEPYAAELASAYSPFSDEVEMYRALRNQLLLTWFSRGNRVLAMLGTEPHVGTSALAANLGVLFAQIGERTLIVDANLRQPRQGQIFAHDRQIGLSDVLSGRAGLEAIRPVRIVPELSVLPAGIPVPNPLDLVSRSSLAETLHSFAKSFDVVLVDAPDFSARADAIAVATRVGGVLIIAAKDRTKVGKLEQMRKSLQMAGVQIVGSVLVEG